MTPVEFHLSVIQAPTFPTSCLFVVNQGRVNCRIQNQMNLYKLRTWLQAEPTLQGNVTAGIKSQEIQDFTKWPKQLFIRRCVKIVGLNVHKLKPNSHLLPPITKALSLVRWVSHNGQFIFHNFHLLCSRLPKKDFVEVTELTDLTYTSNLVKLRPGHINVALVLTNASKTVLLRKFAKEVFSFSG